MKFLALAILLVLAGCIEAADSIGGAIRQRTYCVAPPDAVVLCETLPPAERRAARVYAAPRT